MGFISESIRGLIQVYKVCGIQDVRAWDLLYDISCLDPVMTHRLSQFQLMWPHRRCRSSSVREWWAAFRSYMGQMFDETHDQMTNWWWGDAFAFGDQVDCYNPLSTRSRKDQRTREHFSWYGRDDRRANIEPPSCGDCRLDNFLIIRPLNCDEIIDKDDDDETLADPGALSGGRSHRGDGNDNDDGEGEEDTQGGEK